MDNIKLVSGKSKSNNSGTRTVKNTTVVAEKSVQRSPKKQMKNSKTPKQRPKNNGGKKVIIAVAIVAAVICVALLGLGTYANGLETIFPNVSMDGIDLSGMTEAEAADTLVANNIGTDDDRELKVSLPAGCEMTISAKEAGCYLDAPDAAVYAYNECHNGGFFKNAATYIKCLISGLDLTTGGGAVLNEDYLIKKTDDAAKQVSLALLDSSVEIGEDNITVVKGASAVQVDSEDLLKTVKDALVSGNFEEIKFNATSNGEKSEELDLQNLYDTIYQEPVNAVYDPATKKAAAHVTGRSFDMDAAKKLWDEAQNGDKVVIPLIKTEPEITTDKLNSMLFAEVLSQKSTSLSGSSSSRINNVTRAAASINGIILNPGEEFSYNKTLGQRTKAAGYMEAGAYSGGKVVQEVGGGICQVSSTLYYCTLIANLEITERTCHYFGVAYLPAGLDATVSWPTPDFKFKNSSEYPIKIEAFVDKAANAVVVKLYGSNPEGTRVEMKTESWKTNDGYGAVSYRYVYDKDGNLLSKKEEARSLYHYHVAESPSPSPSVSASPSPSSTATTSPSASPTPTQPVSPSPSAPVNPVSGTDLTTP